jgi:hypothetical protein
MKCRRRELKATHNLYEHPFFYLAIAAGGGNERSSMAQLFRNDSVFELQQADPSAHFGQWRALCDGRQPENNKNAINHPAHALTLCGRVKFSKGSQRG